MEKKNEFVPQSKESSPYLKKEESSVINGMNGRKRLIY